MSGPKITRFLMSSCIVLASAAAWAKGSNATIAGVVKDASGAVLPGVTVEAASPALIEKVRTSVTDSQGLFRIVDLRPGTYTLTFTLPGFSTLKREGLQLTAGFTATVNAELKVGEVAETITVTGEYVLHVTANDYSGEGGSDEVCCWTTALVKVTVTP